MIKVVISGILGKMGQTLKQTIELNQEFMFVGGYDHLKESHITSELSRLPDSDVIIDFSHPSALINLLDYATVKKIPLVIATTGYNQVEMDAIKEASLSIPIFYSANYSVGVYLINQALKKIVKSIETDYDIEIIEKHHHFKKDAPSGTALKFAETINQSLSKPKPIIKGDSLQNGIHIHSLRLGNYVGEHEVIFSSMEETISLTHIAHDKKVFAVGALKAAQFLIKQAPGLYGMDDLFGGHHE